MTDSMREKIDKATKERYACLKVEAPDLFKRCVESASAIALNNNLNSKVAASIESALVAMAVEAMAYYG